MQILDLEEGEIFLIDKPLTWTSFDVVAKIRNTLRIKKIGHGGTLDPLATGLLLIATGKKTKILNQLQDADKSYRMILTLGATTPSYDAEFPPENLCSADHITTEMLTETFRHFTGTIEQFPPAFSAVKTGGKTAYDLARKGINPELKARTVQINKLELIEFRSVQHIEADIDCSKGTYIRSLANDIGAFLKVGGYLSGLVRTRIGEYSLANAWELSDFLTYIKSDKVQIKVSEKSK